MSIKRSSALFSQYGIQLAKDNVDCVTSIDGTLVLSVHVNVRASGSEGWSWQPLGLYTGRCSKETSSQKHCAVLHSTFTERYVVLPEPTAGKPIAGGKRRKRKSMVPLWCSARPAGTLSAGSVRVLAPPPCWYRSATWSCAAARECFCPRGEIDAPLNQKNGKEKRAEAKIQDRTEKEIVPVVEEQKDRRCLTIS